jgi:hypothetical protein
MKNNTKSRSATAAAAESSLLANPTFVYFSADLQTQFQASML